MIYETVIVLFVPGISCLLINHENLFQSLTIKEILLFFRSLWICRSCDLSFVQSESKDKCVRTEAANPLFNRIQQDHQRFGMDIQNRTDSFTLLSGCP